MRTTLTSDDDVVRTITEEMTAGEEKSFKKAVNDLIRISRYRRKEQPEVSRRKPFRVQAKNLGTYAHLNYDNISELQDEIEGPFHR